MTKYLIRLEGSSRFYTVENGQLVQTQAWIIEDEAFEEYGFDSLAGLGSILAAQTVEVTLYAWSTDGVVSTTATLTGCPLQKFIETQAIDVAAEHIVSVSGIEYSVSGQPCMSVQIDGGDWVCYNGVSWVTGITYISYMATLSESVWEELLDGATTMKVRVWLTSDTDSISSFKMNFVMN